MSKLQNKLNSLQPYLLQLRFPKGQTVIDMVFKEGWQVPQSNIIKSNKGESEHNYHMFYSTDDNIELDGIISYIEKVIDLNVEREEKQKLLKLKVKELQTLFQETPLSILKGMTFSSPTIIREDSDSESLDIVLDLPKEMASDINKVPKNKIVEEVIDKDDKIVEDVIDKSVEESTEIKEEFEKFDLTEYDTTPKLPITTKHVKGQRIELPTKKIKLEVFNEPTNIICNCIGEDQICPVCEEVKIGSY